MLDRDSACPCSAIPTTITAIHTKNDDILWSTEKWKNRRVRIFAESRSIWKVNCDTRTRTWYKLEAISFDTCETCLNFQTKLVSTDFTAETRSSDLYLFCFFFAEQPTVKTLSVLRSFHCPEQFRRFMLASLVNRQWCVFDAVQICEFNWNLAFYSYLVVFQET